MATVGAFTMTMDGTVEGPAEYMACPSGFADIEAKMESGRSAVFNYGGSPLVAIQTHYAAWKGMREMATMSERAHASQQAFLASRKGGR